MSVDPSNPYPAVSGFLCPAMQTDNGRGGVLNVFTDIDDVRRIEAGHACGNCCATFYSFQLVCPVCKKHLDVTRARQDAPQDLRDYVKGRGPEASPFRGASFDDAMADVLSDPDVENVRMSQLKPSKWGRGG